MILLSLYKLMNTNEMALSGIKHLACDWNDPIQPFRVCVLPLYVAVAVICTNSNQIEFRIYIVTGTPGLGQRF